MESSETERGERRRAAVLDAARELFLTHGYEGTSLDMVIERAGGSRRTVYQRFGNKEGLFAATVEAMLGELLERLAALDWECGTPRETLTRVGTELVCALSAPDTIALFRMLVAEVDRFPELGAAMYRKGPEQAYRQVADYLRRQHDAGRLAIEDADLAARQLVEMMKGDLHMRALLRSGDLPGRRTIARHVELAVRTFLDGAAVRRKAGR